MTDDRLAAALGVALGPVPAGLFYADGYREPLPLFALWATFAAVVWLAARNPRALRADGSRWRSLLFVVLVPGGAMAVRSWSPLAGTPADWVAMLVLNVGTAAYLLGIEVGRREADDVPGPDRDREESAAEAAD